MKFFHMADLHLGKTVYEHELIEDQCFALEQVVQAAAEQKPDCVLIAGDVFDRAVPPPEAIRLFGDFTAKLRTLGIRHVAVIPGNHDSAARLAFLAPVLHEAGVYIASDAALCDRPVSVTSSGESARLWLLPFLQAGAFQSDNPECEIRGQSELFREAIKKILPAMEAFRRAEPDAYDILVCHAFTQGGTSSESERVFIGAAEYIDSADFCSFDYTALGHLHRYQTVGNKAAYSGSLLPYSFSEGETEHGIACVELSQAQPDSTRIDFIPVAPLRRMKRIAGSYEQLLSDSSLSVYENDYIEAALDDALPALNPMDGLRKRFPHILSIRTIRPAHDSVEALHENERRLMERNDPCGDFTLFYRSMRGTEPDSVDMAIFKDLYEEAVNENK